ncbi:MAG: 2-phosphosulfolactate phosphatase [Vampirovibrionia bacterium]
MHIDLLFSPLEVKRITNLNQKTSIVIDVLRASTTMIYALNGYDNTTNVLKGVREIKPAKDIETAFKLKENPENYHFLLAGERNGYPPEGFNFGNSPEDFTIDKTHNKSIIMATTNGTKILNLLLESNSIVVGSFVNALAVAKKIVELNNDIVIGCAGREDLGGLEDITCGGLIIKHIYNIMNCDLDLSDSAKIAVKTYDSYNNELDILKDSFHGKFLIDIGLEKDLEICSKKDIFNIVPTFNNGLIKPHIIE